MGPGPSPHGAGYMPRTRHGAPLLVLALEARRGACATRATPRTGPGAGDRECEAGARRLGELEPRFVLTPGPPDREDPDQALLDQIAVVDVIFSLGK